MRKRKFQCLWATVFGLAFVACDQGSKSEAEVEAASQAAPAREMIESAATSPSEVQETEKPAIPAVAQSLDVDADIAGVKLGMTKDEVVAALKAFEPSKEPAVAYNLIRPLQGVYSITEDTPGAYVNVVRLNLIPASSIDAKFQGPPVDNVVVSIERKQNININFEENRTSIETYRSALIEKYGEPSFEPASNSDARLVMKWLFPKGAADCTPVGEQIPNRGIRTWPNHPAHFWNPPETCATSLIYTLTMQDGIVSNVHAKLANPALEFGAQTRTQDYLADVQRQDAEAAREQATKKPNL